MRRVGARWAIPAVAPPSVEPLAFALAALVLRLLHLRFTARRPVADDAVFFQQHAGRFLEAWAVIRSPAFWPALRDAVDHASLQGIVYPLFQSLVYRLAGGVVQEPLLVAQAVLGALTVWLTYRSADLVFGRPAARVAGILAALYAPFVLASGLLLAEALLLAMQGLALFLLLRGLQPDRAGDRFWGGLTIGLLMLRPAFQYAGPALALALVGAGLLRSWGTDSGTGTGTRPAEKGMASAARGVRAVLAGLSTGLRAGLRLAAPYVAGVLLVAVPWMAVNGLVYGSYVWSRTGDAWQQIYWGIYPPNRGWWPPDSPVPPKFGVESLPGAWAAGLKIEPRDLDYLEAAVQQVQATPLQAVATEVNKVYQAYLHPFNNYGERPPLAGALAVPLHRALAFLALAGLALAWRRPGPGLVLGAALLAFGLPFLASHIDVRYIIPPAQVGILFAALAVAEALPALGVARRRRTDWPIVMAIPGLPLAAWGLGVPVLTGALPGLPPWRAHLLQTALVLAAFAGAGWLAGTLLAGAGLPRARRRVVASLSLAGALLAALYGVQSLYDGDWHEWSTRVTPAGAVRQTIILPPGWAPPAGSRAELRLYLQGSPAPVYEPTVWANGREIARLGPAFSDAGPLRFDRVLMDSASRQGKTRPDVPQWYAVPLDLSALAQGRVEVEVAAERLAGAGAADAWLRVWGDFPSGTSGPSGPSSALGATPGTVAPAAPPARRFYDGPAVHSRILGADIAFHKLMATGQPMLWRRAALSSLRAEPAWREGAAWRSDDLSDAFGRQSGEYRIRLLVLAANGDLVALF